MKQLFILTILSGSIFFSSCLATTEPIGASLKSTNFSNNSAKKITLLDSDVEVEKEGFLGRNKVDKSGTKKIVSGFEQKFDSLFLIEEIDLIIEDDSVYESAKHEKFSEDIKSLNKNYLSNKKRKDGIIDQHPKFDLSNSDININTDYGIYISVKGSENTSYISTTHYNSSIKTEYTSFISYIFDISNNKIVWIYEYVEESNIEKVNIDSFIKSMLFSLKYGKDLKPKSFELEPSDERVLLTKQDGFQLFGNIENVSHFEITFKNIEGVSTIHLDDIKSIEIPSRSKTLFPFEI